MEGLKNDKHAQTGLIQLALLGKKATSCHSLPLTISVDPSNRILPRSRQLNIAHPCSVLQVGFEKIVKMIDDMAPLTGARRRVQHRANSRKQIRCPNRWGDPRIQSLLVVPEEPNKKIGFEKIVKIIDDMAPLTGAGRRPKSRCGGLLRPSPKGIRGLHIVTILQLYSRSVALCACSLPGEVVLLGNEQKDDDAQRDWCNKEFDSSEVDRAPRTWFTY